MSQNKETSKPNMSCQVNYSRNMTSLAQTSICVASSPATAALEKRLRDSDHDLGAETSPAPTKKLCVDQEIPRLSSVPSLKSISLTTTENMPRSKSAGDFPTDLSPVQLLKSFTTLKRPLNEGPLFVKPSKTDLACYNTAVVNAIRSSNLETLRQTHEDGKSLNACNQFGESLLHMACRRGNPDVVRYLVNEAKVNVAVRDDYGRTCLHDATWTSKPNFSVMEILLDAMNPEMLLVEDVRGHTPFDYARKEHWSEWNIFLKDHVLPKLDQPAQQVVA